jgi:hypothetical protein
VRSMALRITSGLRMLVSRLVRFCSNADGSLSAFLSRNAAFRQTKAFAFAPDICETRH